MEVAGMALETLLLERNLLQPHEIDAAREHQKVARCSLITSVLALDLLSREELNAVLGEAPPSPETLEETGLDLRFLLGQVLKTMLMEGSETPTEIARTLCLPEQVIDEVLADAKEKRLVEVLGLADTRRSIYRYALTDAGTSWASDSLDQCHYIGPAPVRLDAYRTQASRQTIARDTAGPESMARALSHLVLPQGLVDQLGPATNSGKSVLLYGASGNGKTSIAEALGRAFEQPIYIPHCFEVGGQIVRFFDPAVHEPWEELNLADEPGDGQEFDRRWVKCKRPVIITGGELTIEMLDLNFDPVSKFYEAPAHLKANGGVFIIDDFGRQRVRSTDLLNRWILPLERRVDLLTLHTGKKVEVPFDQLVIFSTNYPPGELLDEAGLRRVPYKFMIDSPNRDEYATILRRVCETHRVPLGEGVLEYLLDVFYPETGLPISGAHPRFVVDHVLERCRFHGAEPRMSPELVREASSHLLIEGSAPPVYYRA
jgi:hypothetical protein